MEKRDVGIAYLLLIVAGLFGAHRYYTGRKTSAVWMTCLTVSVVGVVVTGVWAVVDLFLTARFTAEYNDRVRAYSLPAYGPVQDAVRPAVGKREVRGTPDAVAWAEHSADRQTGGKHRATA